MWFLAHIAAVWVAFGWGLIAARDSHGPPNAFCPTMHLGVGLEMLRCVKFPPEITKETTFFEKIVILFSERVDFTSCAMTIRRRSAVVSVDTGTTGLIVDQLLPWTAPVTCCGTPPADHVGRRLLTVDAADNVRKRRRNYRAAAVF